MILAAGKRVNKSFGFLKSSCRHNFINQCPKLDVAAQPHTLYRRLRFTTI